MCHMTRVLWRDRLVSLAGIKLLLTHSETNTKICGMMTLLNILIMVIMFIYTWLNNDECYT